MNIYWYDTSDSLRIFSSHATYSLVADYLNFRLLMYLYNNFTVYDIISTFFHNMIYIIHRNCSMAFRFPHVCCQLLAAPHICVPRRSLIILYTSSRRRRSSNSSNSSSDVMDIILQHTCQLFEELKTISCFL